MVSSDFSISTVLHSCMHLSKELETLLGVLLHAYPLPLVSF